MTAILVRPILAKGRHLEELLFHHDAQHAEGFAGEVGDTREKPLQLFAPRAGGDVVVLRLEAEEMIAHAASREIRGVAGPLELGDNVTRMRVHGSAKNGSTSAP